MSDSMEKITEIQRLIRRLIRRLQFEINLDHKPDMFVAFNDLENSAEHVKELLMRYKNGS